MSKRRRSARKKRKNPRFILFIVCFFLALFYQDYQEYLKPFPVSLLRPGSTAAPSQSEPESTEASKTLPASGDGALTVQFIDVGQGDCILAESDGHYMLIDAGENDKGAQVVSFLEEAGVSSFDYIIGTHPHSDHIGGLDDVIRAFPAENIILPPVAHTTKTYEDVLDAVEEAGVSLTRPVPGDSYALGDAVFTILAPVGDYGTDLNNWSVGIRLTLGDTAFVLCGDAESQAEQDMVNNGITLSADVLKVGHHGSSTSSCDAFLDAVSPDYAVIQCGKGNSYGHPHAETLKKLEKRNIEILRTDELGTITAASDGASITWSY
jgi:beta-lactamase superfamily II metal-dependent hydrolase